MTTNQKLLGAFVGLALVVLGGFVGYQLQSDRVGGSSFHEQFPIFFDGGLNAGSAAQLTIDSSGNLVTSGTTKLGSSGTALTSIVTGTCTIWAPAQTIAATTTQAVECQSATNGTLASGLTGVTSGAFCAVLTASSTNSTIGGIVVAGTSASTTAGSIVLRLSNLTGTTFTWNATASSSAKWKYLCVQ